MYIALGVLESKADRRDSCVRGKARLMVAFSIGEVLLYVLPLVDGVLVGGSKCTLFVRVALLLPALTGEVLLRVWFSPAPEPRDSASDAPNDMLVAVR